MLKAKLDAIQSRAFNLIRPGHTVVLALGRGTGKTYLDRIAIHSIAFQYPGIHIGLLLPSLKQARAVFWPHLIADYTDKESGIADRMAKRPNMSALEAVYDNGSRLTTWGAENAQSIRGQRFGAIVQDETDDIHPAIEEAVVAPTFSKAGTKAIWIKSGTPRQGRHGILYRDLQYAREDRKRPKAERRYFGMVVPSRESPQVDQVWLAERKERTDPAVFKREYECDFDSGEGLVYDVFDEEFHVRRPNPRQVGSEVLIGVDHGYVDPAVFLVIGVMGSGNDAVCWAIEEWYRTGQGDDHLVEQARKLKEKYPSAKWFADPSRPDKIRMYRDKAGVWVQEAKNSIDDGVSAVATRFMKREVRVNDTDTRTEARFYVSPDCPNFIEELGLYKRPRDPKNPDIYLEGVVSQHDHACDCARYAIFSRFGKPDSSRIVRTGYSFG